MVHYPAKKDPPKHFSVWVVGNKTFQIAFEDKLDAIRFLSNQSASSDLILWEFPVVRKITPSHTQESQTAQQPESLEAR